MSVNVNVTTTGFPDDCLFIGELTVSKEMKLEELKQAVLSMQHFQGNEIAVECIRIRDKLNDMFFGKIYRAAHNKTLKQLNIKN